MIEIKRNCSSSIRDYGDKIIFGSFTITINNFHYTNFRKLMDKYSSRPPIEILRWLIESELIE